MEYLRQNAYISQIILAWFSRDPLSAWLFTSLEALLRALASKLWHFKNYLLTFTQCSVLKTSESDQILLL